MPVDYNLLELIVESLSERQISCNGRLRRPLRGAVLSAEQFDRASSQIACVNRGYVMPLLADVVYWYGHMDRRRGVFTLTGGDFQGVVSNVYRIKYGDFNDTGEATDFVDGKIVSRGTCTWPDLWPSTE